MKALVLADATDHVTDLAVSECGLQILPKGTTLVVVRGMILAHTFPVCVTGQAGTINQDIKALLPNGLIDASFLPWLLRGWAPVFLSLTDQSAHGTVALRTDRFLGEPMLVPSIEEQSAIASYLEAETRRIGESIDAKKELLELVSSLDSMAFYSVLSATAGFKDGRYDEQLPWLRELPRSWGRCKIKHIVLSFDQGVSPQCESRAPDEDEWGVLKVGCVNSGRFNPRESKALPPEISPVPAVTVEKNDLLVSRANTKNLVGRSAIAEQSFPKLMLSDKLYRLKVDSERCLPEFVRRVMWIPAVRQHIEERATGASSSMLNIDRRTILEITIPLPTVEEQAEILRAAEVASLAAQELIAHVEREIYLLRELRSSTITDAVLGRIDVREHMKN
jgi:type I restriction enzyme S subunit